MNDINQRTMELVCRVLGTDSFSVDPSMPRDAIAQWDSLKHIQVILALEDEFSVEFSDVEIANTRSIGELVSLVKSKARA